MNFKAEVLTENQDKVIFSVEAENFEKLYELFANKINGVKELPFIVAVKYQLDEKNECVYAEKIYDKAIRKKKMLKLRFKEYELALKEKIIEYKTGKSVRDTVKKNRLNWKKEEPFNFADNLSQVINSFEY